MNFSPAIDDACISPAAHSDTPPCQANSAHSHPSVGQGAFAEVHALTSIEREAAIELVELREIFYEKGGYQRHAEFMRVCRARLEAGRK